MSSISEMMKRKAIGRTCYLGYMYDARREEIINLSLFNDTLPSELIESYETPNTRYDFTLADSYEEKFEKLSVDAQMKLNVMCGLFKLEGSGKYLNDEKKSNKSVKASMIYEIQTRKENVTISNKNISPYISLKSLEAVGKENSATHAIVGIQWGASALCTFEYENNENIDKTQIEDNKNLEGKFMASFSKLKFIANMSAEANVEHDSNEIDLKTKTSISLIADINSKEELPTQYEAVIEYIKKFPQYVEKTNKGKGVPIEIELLPLDYVCRMFDFEIKIEYVINNLNVEIINRFEKEFDSLLKWKRTLFDIIKEVQSNSNLFPDASYIRLLRMQRDLTLSENQLKDEVTKLLYKIRCGKEQESKLTGVLDEYQKSGKAHEIEKELGGKFVLEIKNQIQFINCLRSNDIECIDKSKDLNLLVQTAKNEDVYVLKYDQDLKATNPLVFEKNWTYFLMLKRTKPAAKFFIFDYKLNNKDSNQNNRIVINHYKNGHLIENDLIEYLKVELDDSIAKPINHSTLESLPLQQGTSKSELYELKLPCPNWKTTYGCSTEKLNWKCMKCKEIFVYDSELMFICGCSKVSYQHFGYKCVNSHHPRHPENEFIKYENLDELKNYLLSSIKKKTAQIDENKNIEQLIWFDFNIDNEENKFHQTKLKIAFDSMKFHSFKDLNQLEGHLNKSKTIRSLLIVSGSAYQAVFDKFYDLKQISDILIFTSRSREIDMSKYSKVRKMVFSVLELIDCIRNILNNNFEASAKWQWKNDFNSFSCYDANVSQQIEGFYQHYLKDDSQKMRQLQIKRNDFKTIDNYIIDFEKMCQINEKTKYKRILKRIIE